MDCGKSSNVLNVVFGIFNENVEISVFIKYSGIHNFKFRIVFSPDPVFLNQLFVREFILRILVQHFHIAVRWGRVKMIVKFFYILSMVALMAGQPKKSFFDHGVFSIPKSPGYTKFLFIIRNSSNSLFSPAIGLAFGLIMSDIVPGGSIGTIILSYCTPLTIGEVRTPLLPMFLPLPVFLKPLFFYIHESYIQISSLEFTIFSFSQKSDLDL